MIWLLGEAEPEGNRYTKWQLLYALPPGFGISCCEKEYVMEHFGELQSRYIAALAGGEVDQSCRAAGYTELNRDGDMVLYRMD